MSVLTHHIANFVYRRRLGLEGGVRLLHRNREQDPPAFTTQLYTPQVLSELSHAKLQQPFGKSFASIQEGGKKAIYPEQDIYRSRRFSHLYFSKRNGCLENKLFMQNSKFWDRMRINPIIGII